MHRERRGTVNGEGPWPRRLGLGLAHQRAGTAGADLRDQRSVRGQHSREDVEYLWQKITLTSVAKKWSECGADILKGNLAKCMSPAAFLAIFLPHRKRAHHRHQTVWPSEGDRGKLFAARQRNICAGYMVRRSGSTATLQALDRTCCRVCAGVLLGGGPQCFKQKRPAAAAARLGVTRHGHWTGGVQQPRSSGARPQGAH